MGGKMGVEVNSEISRRFGVERWDAGAEIMDYRQGRSRSIEHAGVPQPKGHFR